MTRTTEEREEANEETALVEQSDRYLVFSIVRVISLGILYVCVSAGMIAFNKFLMHPGRFPFAVPLVMFHSFFSSVLALILYFLVPSLFPSLTDPVRKVSIDKDLIVWGALPIALVFSVQLVLSNTAYLHSSTAFLQMIKESNLVLVYSFSLIAALETFSWVKGRVLVAIVVATAITIHGELNFSWYGFVIQGSGQVFESMKIVFQGLLLSSAGRKLDALSYILLVMPFCFLILSTLFYCLAVVHPLEMLQTPLWNDIVIWWPVLLANCCVAFALNVTIALFIKYSSPMGFIMAGITKDACIVVAGATMLGELVSRTQAIAFTLQLGLISVWSLMKLFPQQFAEGILPGFAYLHSRLMGEPEHLSAKIEKGSPA